MKGDEARAVNERTGREIPVEVLTPAQARELRRIVRRRGRKSQEEALRIVRSGLRKVGQGKMEEAAQTMMSGFMNLLLKRLQGPFDGKG